MPTSLDLHQRLVNDKDIISGDYTIRWLEESFLAKEDGKDGGGDGQA